MPNEKLKKEPTKNKRTLMITKFKKEFLKNKNLKLFWSELLEMHYVCTVDGIKLEDGTFVSKARLDNDLIGLEGELIKFYIAGLSVFKDRGFTICN